MIRMVQASSSGQAKSYFSDALMRSDYYMEDQEAGGDYGGLLAARMGLSGKATKEQFYRLCENLHPLTGKKLTLRTNKDRRVGYDINFHCPKSLSVVHALTDDGVILEAFRASVAETMDIIEQDTMTRIRKGGKYANRKTGELLYNTFVHQTARPVGSHAPDPHLHAHVFCMNVTWDEVEKRYKAGEFVEINQKIPLYQAMFHKKLSDKLIAAGYKIRRTERSFEIDRMPEHIIKHFSKRTNEIGQVAKEKGITDAKELSELGARTRSKKNKGMTMPELKADWRRQIAALESAAPKKPVPDATPEKTLVMDAPHPVIRDLSGPVVLEGPTITAQDCADFALSHCFVRASVVPYNKLLTVACRHGIGAGHISVEAIDRRLSTDPRLIRITERDKVVCTTKEVLAEEQKMIKLAQAGKGKFAPLYNQAPKLNLDGQQLEAVTHVLTTKDMVSIIRGAAGTGKTTLMKEAIPAIKAAGKEVIVVAPTVQASRLTLRQEVDEKADTVAMLLCQRNMQDRLQNQVLWIDEAGMLGTKDMAALLEVAHKKQARVICGGDTRQHSSVERGDALRVLSTVGDIRTAEVSRIYRQKNGLYKNAVEDLSKGDVKAGFDKLDSLGFVREVDPMKGNEALVNDYARAVALGKSCLVIAPTHKQGQAVTAAIRDKLKQSGLIDDKEIATYALVNKNLTEAEKSDWRNYEPGQVVQFNQNMKHPIKRGSRWKVDGVQDQDIKLRDDQGKTISLPTHAGAKFDVFEFQEIDLAKGDKVRVTKNGFDSHDKALNNGQTFDVLSVTNNGTIKLRSSISDATYTIDRNFGHIAHAHCVTSQFSQGKTVDQVFISQPAATFGATNAKQFYVSVSRAREQATIYTDRKEELLVRASELGDRRSAIELVSGQEKHFDYVLQLERGKGIAPPVLSGKGKNIEVAKTIKPLEVDEPKI